jgi:hypothetical protein
MKNTYKAIMAALTIFLLASCSGLLAPETGVGTEQRGPVIVRISSADSAGSSSKAIAPAVRIGDFKYFEVELTDVEGNTIVIRNVNPEGESVEGLSPGIWNAAAYGYLAVPPANGEGVTSGYGAKSSESEPHLILGEPEEQIVINLELSPFREEGKTGTFTWDKYIFQTMVDSATMKITGLPPDGQDVLSVNLNAWTAVSKNTGESLLQPGDYIVAITAKVGDKTWGVTELIKIYSNLPTALPFTVDDILPVKPLTGDFRAQGDIANNIKSVKITALSSISTDNTELASHVISNYNTGALSSWTLRVPMSAESVRLKVDFFASTDGTGDPLDSDTGFLSGIDVKGKTNISLSYSGALRPISVTVTGSGDSSVEVYSEPGATTPIASAYAGETVWLKVTRAEGYYLSALNAGLSIPDPISGGKDNNRDIYSFVVPASTSSEVDPGLTVTAAFAEETDPAVLPKIVCYGDSITLGIGEGNWVETSSTFNKNWSFPGYLSEFLYTERVEVVNQGENGRASGNVLETVYDSVIAQDPAVVILNFGINDIILEYENPGGYTFSKTQKNLNELLRKLADGKRWVYISKFLTDDMLRTYLEEKKVAVDRRDELVKKYKDMYVSFVANYPQVKVIDDIWTGVWQLKEDEKWTYGAYGWHPAAVVPTEGIAAADSYGYRRMAWNIISAIKTLGYGGFETDGDSTWIQPGFNLEL